MIRRARRRMRRVVQLATVAAIAGTLGGPLVLLAAALVHSGDVATVGAYWMLAAGLAAPALRRRVRPPQPAEPVKVEAEPEREGARYYRIPHPRSARRRGQAKTGTDTDTAKDTGAHPAPAGRRKPRK